MPTLTTEHLKRSNSNSSIRKIRLTIVTNTQAVAHKSWVARCFPSTPGCSCNNLHNFHGFNHSHSLSSHHKDFSLPVLLASFNPSNNLLKISLHISLRLSIHATKVLPYNLHLKLDIVEENLSNPGFRQGNLNLITLPHSPTPSID